MEELKVKARAKVNLGLDVLRKREDGYHELRMVMQSLRLHDEISLAVQEEPGIRLWTDAPGLAADERNLAWRAADCLMEEFAVAKGLRIELRKRIPMAAGLAGGSADAAAVLKGVNELFGLGLSREELCARGVRLGADVPYCVMQGTALAEGIGEKLTPLPAAPDCHVVLAKPGISVSTAFVYGNLRVDQIGHHPDIDGQAEAIRRRDFSRMAELMGNVLETVTVPAHPEIRAIADELIRLGAANAMMSGSGPTVFGLFEDGRTAREAFGRMKEQRPGCEVFLTEFFDPAGE